MVLDRFVNQWDWPVMREPGFVLVTTHPAGQALAELFVNGFVSAFATRFVRVVWDTPRFGSPTTLPTWCEAAFDRTPNNPCLPDQAHIDACEANLRTARKTVIVLGPGWREALRDGVTDHEVSQVTGHIVGTMGLVWLITDEDPRDHSGPPGYGRVRLRHDDLVATAYDILAPVAAAIRATRRAVPAA